MLEKIREYANKEWSKVMDALSAQVPLNEVLDEMESKLKELLSPLEARAPKLSQEEIFSLLILRQLDANIKVARRDGVAPFISSIVYFIEDTLYDAIILAQLGKRKEAASLRDLLDDALIIFEYEYMWNYYIHTLFSMHRLYKTAKHHLPSVEGFAKWGKKLERALEKGLAMRGKPLQFYLPPYYLYRGLIPIKISPEGARKISNAIISLWETLKDKRVGLKVFAPIEGDEKGQIWLDFYDGLVRNLNERLHRTFNLPVMDVPLNIRVAYDEEAHYTQSVAYFKREGDGYSVTFFKPKGMPIIPAEDAHIVFHEVVPGHAYANFLEDKFGTHSKPVTLAWSASLRLFPSFVDAFSLVHEGWALLAQELGTRVTASDEVRKAMINEILMYVERVLVIERNLPFHTVKTYIPRIADPYQFASYFIGYIVYRMLVRKKGLEAAVRTIANGIYPMIEPFTEDEIVHEVRSLLPLAKD